MFTDADNFGINFPLDLDVKVCVKIHLTTYLVYEKDEFQVKATLLGALFLIDFMYFEHSNNNNNNHNN